MFGDNSVVVLPEGLHEKPAALVRNVPVPASREGFPLRLRQLAVFARSARRFPRARTLFLHERSGRRWAVFFCYRPRSGSLDDSYRFTIQRLKEEGFAVLVVLATTDEDQVEAFRAFDLDGLIVKDLGGYDFSGYTLGLTALTQAFGEVDVLVLNDSVLGPFRPVTPLVDAVPWRVVGFVSNNAVMPHIQSFAFYIRRANCEFMAAMGSVFLRRVAFDSQGPVSFLQEMRLGQVAARRFPTGVLFAPLRSDDRGYYLLGNPEGLLEAGFPFLKKSIYTKFQRYFDQGHYRELLARLGHQPVGTQ